MPQQRKESMQRRIAWAMLAVLSLVALGWSVYTGIQRREYVECSVQQTDLIIRYLEETRQAAAEERAATDRVRQAQVRGDVEGAKQAIRDYFETRQASDERRKNAPLPALPDVVCGEPKP